MASQSVEGMPTRLEPCPLPLSSAAFSSSKAGASLLHELRAPAPRVLGGKARPEAVGGIGFCARRALLMSLPGQLKERVGLICRWRVSLSAATAREPVDPSTGMPVRFAH